MAEHRIAISFPMHRHSAFTPQSERRVPRLPWRLIPILFILAAIIVGPIIAPSPITQSLADRLQPPFGFGGTWFGTDGLGRSLLARILIGARNSLQVSTIAATGAAIIGVAAGMFAGMMGGWIDRFITLLVETVLAVPFITVGLMITATIGQSALALILLLIGTGWITHARVLRSQAQVLAKSEFVRASQSLGASRVHVMKSHILPNLMPVAIVVYFQQVGSMLLWSASLTWLGIGMPIEHISLGGIVRDGQDLLYNGWWISAIGGFTIVFIVTALNLAADWLRLVLDPTTKGQNRA